MPKQSALQHCTIAGAIALACATRQDTIQLCWTASRDTSITATTQLHKGCIASRRDGVHNLPTLWKPSAVKWAHLITAKAGFLAQPLCHLELTRLDSKASAALRLVCLCTVIQSCLILLREAVSAACLSRIVVLLRAHAMAPAANFHLHSLERPTCYHVNTDMQACNTHRLRWMQHDNFSPGHSCNNAPCRA